MIENGDDRKIYWFILFILKEIKTIFFYDVIIPNEIINYIMLLFTPSIHPKNICPCDLKQCKEEWNDLIGEQYLCYYKKINHCNGVILLSLSDDIGSCHTILNNENNCLICDKCNRIFCFMCGEIIKNNKGLYRFVCHNCVYIESVETFENYSFDEIMYDEIVCFV